MDPKLKDIAKEELQKLLDVGFILSNFKQWVGFTFSNYA